MRYSNADMTWLPDDPPEAKELAALRRCAEALDRLIAQCEGAHEDVDLADAVDALAALDKEAKT